MGFSVDKLVRIERGLARWRGTTSEQRRRELFFRLAGRFTPAIAVDCGGVRYVVSTTDRVVGMSLFTRGRFDDHLSDVFAVLRELPGGADNRRRTLIEVGANIGTTTIPALRGGFAARAVAIEPHPANVALLRQNLAANELSERARVLGVAISDRVGVADLAVSSDNGGGHWIASQHRDGDRQASATSTVAVATTTLDALIAKGELDLAEVVLVWIDAQGHEAHVLAGAERLLASDVPVLAEYWPHGLRGAGALERFEALVSRNYSDFVDLGRTKSLDGAEPASSIRDLRQRYAGPAGFSDLLLLKLKRYGTTPAGS